MDIKQCIGCLWILADNTTHIFKFQVWEWTKDLHIPIFHKINGKCLLAKPKPQSINSVCNGFPTKFSVGAKARRMVAHLNYAKPSSLRNRWFSWGCSANPLLFGWYKENPQHILSQSPRPLWWILGHFFCSLYPFLGAGYLCLANPRQIDFCFFIQTWLVFESPVMALNFIWRP